MGSNETNPQRWSDILSPEEIASSVRADERLAGVRDATKDKMVKVAEIDGGTHRVLGTKPDGRTVVEF